jgi:hypothetical protein
MHPGSTRVDLENRSNSASVNELRQRVLWISDFDVFSLLHTCRNLWKFTYDGHRPISGHHTKGKAGWAGDDEEVRLVDRVMQRARFEGRGNSSCQSVAVDRKHRLRTKKRNGFGI